GDGEVVAGLGVRGVDALDAVASVLPGDPGGVLRVERERGAALVESAQVVGSEVGRHGLAVLDEGVVDVGVGVAFPHVHPRGRDGFSVGAHGYGGAVEGAGGEPGV